MPVDYHWAHAVLSGLRAAPGTSVIFEHFGPLDQDVVGRLLESADATSRASNDPMPVRKRLITVLTEGSENTHRHVRSEHRSSSFVVLAQSPEGYRLAVGNALPHEAAKDLQGRVETLNKLDDPALKEGYMEVLSNGLRTKNGGAGLGMWAMARRSTRPMLAWTLPLDAASAYFVLELAIQRN